MCDVECVRISGYCKGCHYRPGDTFKDLEPNHEWNCVNLDGVWSLVDCCWGAGYIDETSGDFVQVQRKLYCFTDPNVFIVDHFPVDSKWQLLGSIIKLETFEATANVKHGFFIHNVQLCNHKEAVITCKENCNIQLSFPKPIDISYKLLGKNLIGVNAYVDYSLQEKQADIQCTLPFTGKFTFVVYGKERSTREHSCFSSIVTYTIDNITETVGWNLDPSHGSWGPNTRFYELGLQECLPIKTSLLHDTKGGPLCVTYYSNNPHLQLKGDVYKQRTISRTKLNNCTFTNRPTDGQRHLLVNVPSKEKHILKVYTRCNSNKNFELIACYKVQSVESNLDVISFPKMTTRWLKSNCTLVSPMKGLLTQNQNVHFHLIIKDALDVTVVLPEKKSVRLKSDQKHVWKGTVNVGNAEGSVRIFARTISDNCYHKYLQFSIQKEPC